VYLAYLKFSDLVITTMSFSLLTVSKSYDNFCFKAVNLINESAKSQSNCLGMYSQQFDVNQYSIGTVKEYLKENNVAVRL